MTEQLIYQIGLTMVNGIGDILGRQLLQTLGDAKTIFTEKPHVLEKIPGIGRMLAGEIKRPDVLKRAEKELSFIEKNKITCYFLPDPDYPAYLREFNDAPLLLYFKGKCDLNCSRSVSVVGTRKPTDYGRSLTETLIEDLAALCPDMLIVSGLAYGIDVLSHQCALKHQLPTVAVLAHGLDRIYPPLHRSVAVEMLENGGLLTEYPSGTTPDKPNFVKRNRIIAGLSNATVVVESANKGGSLITAEIAFSYSRDVFAFPGKTTDPYSQGCNRIIRENRACLIRCAADLVASMRWNVAIDTENKPAVQTELVFSGDEDSDRMLALLREKKEMHINQLAVELDMPVQKILDLLFELEMNQQVKKAPGSIYKPL
ncbi:MAG: DNA-processing protein DprA [Tannerellaceae bacterium]|jgi:DNA processing protein|nr:DNA-processing protein DprA [Tannerellaceae bacterium]